MARVALITVALAATACAADAPAAPPPAPTTAAPPATDPVPSTVPATAPAPAAPPAVHPLPRAGRGAARTSTSVAPATTVAPEGNEGATEQQLARIAACEGYPDYVNRDHPGASSASGKYGVLDGTWDGYGGYESAADAPEAVQDAWAREAYAAAGTRPWRASRGCWGRG